MLTHITKLLKSKFHPEKLLVQDQSSLHDSHFKRDPGTVSHLKITIISDYFSGKSKVQRHRSIYELLETELKTSLHALSLTVLTPQEVQQEGLHEQE
ncbi:MAG: BolA family transcriptional regulator [Proteobacteria bacterium]|nr:BolA family transcriptional regulator [Pseudomonadota bacterium]